MRRFLLVSLAVVLLFFALGAAVAYGVNASGVLNGLNVSVDGETLAIPVVSGLSIALGGSVALVLILVGLFVVAVLASVAVFVPVLLVFIVLAVAFAVVIGLSPVLIPVLLVVGAYVLLSRRSQRRGPAPNGTLPSPPTPS